MTQKFTPGPWMAAAAPSSILGWPVIAAGGRLICTIATPPNNLDRIGKEAAGYEAFLKECGENANLIAAAPDMLTALEYARDKMWAYGFPENELQPVRDAIAKAERKS